MELRSTGQNTDIKSFKEALFHSLASDGGLYMPVNIPVIEQEFWKDASTKSFKDIAIRMSSEFLSDEIPVDKLTELIDSAFDFNSKIVELEENLHVLELFHGPSLAFKDFGARFMASMMSHLLEGEQPLNILVATSGDTGGAVAAGFLNAPNINVVILYPSGKVSALQEKQLTCNGANVRAVEVNGSFDDCQRLVKSAFMDEELNKSIRMSSANSINIARLIPQSFYYAYTACRLASSNKKLIISVPSGNFGNLTAGVMAMKMGAPIESFVASTNANCVVPEYLQFGEYKSRDSVPTISNAMDVGDPSNFPRLSALFDDDRDKMKEKIASFAFTDRQTMNAIEHILDKHNYAVCPHTAIAYLGLASAMQDRDDCTGVFLSTAHPSKFMDVYPEHIKGRVELAPELRALENKKGESISCESDYEDFRNILNALN